MIFDAYLQSKCYLFQVKIKGTYISTLQIKINQVLKFSLTTLYLIITYLEDTLKYKINTI